MAKNLIGGNTTTINESGNDIAVDLNTTYTNFIDVNETLQTTAQTLPEAINELYDGMYYKSGDTITGTFQVAGYITSGTKDLFCMVYVPKSMAKISTVRVNGGTFTLRTTSGNYLNGASGGIAYNASGITTSASKNTDNAVAILMRSTNAYTSVSNNTPVAGTISGLTLTFE